MQYRWQLEEFVWRIPNTAPAVSYLKFLGCTVAQLEAGELGTELQIPDRIPLWVEELSLRQATEFSNVSMFDRWLISLICSSPKILESYETFESQLRSIPAFAKARSTNAYSEVANMLKLTQTISPNIEADQEIRIAELMDCFVESIRYPPKGLQPAVHYWTLAMGYEILYLHTVNPHRHQLLMKLWLRR